MKLPLYTAPLLALTAAIPQAPAMAQSPNRDVRCLMISNLFAKAAPVAQAEVSASQTRMFYLGRVSAKLSGAPLQAAMEAAAETIDPDHAGAEMNKCLATVQASAAAVKAAGDRAKNGLSKRGSGR